MAIDGFGDSAKERLSALVDGELDPAGSTTSCAAWARDAALRADWHAWHLIGDVLRSEDLASNPAPRPRLLREVAVALAGRARRPRADAGHRRAGRRAFRAPGAPLPLDGGAARLLPALSSSLALSLSFGPASAPAAQVARGDAPASIAASPVGAAPAEEASVQPVAIVADGKVFRDAQLERYLEAHKQFAGTSALGVPSAFLRSATVDSAAR